jgi:HlyD family secretion protein
MRKWIKRTVVVAVVGGVIGTALAWYLQRGNSPAVSFGTAQVTRGDLLVTIDASGTLEPEEVVDVGAQVAGQIVAFGTDADGNTVDYGSHVEEGTVLARIDEALAQADVSQAEAQVESAKAGVQRAEADLEQLKAKLSQAERDWERAKKLGPSEALAQASYDSYQSAYEMAKANVGVGEATILQAKAGLAQAKTSLWRAKRNLGYCTITSPVKGVIIDRRVNIGQTVVASLNAPSLFLIAKDLKRMEIWVAVNEADVAKIYPGQPVTFTVYALPDETFRGEVVKVRLNASMTQNVVTYTVEITTDNSSGRLLPYLTADVKFEVKRGEDVLLVPSAALRWTPSVEQVAPEFRDGRPESQRRSPLSTESGPGATAGSDGATMSSGVVYAVQGRYVRPIFVGVGLSSGGYTEVDGEGLAEGLELVTGSQTPSAATSEPTNPFTPKLPAPPKRAAGPPPM